MKYPAVRTIPKINQTIPTLKPYPDAAVLKTVRDKFGSVEAVRRLGNSANAVAESIEAIKTDDEMKARASLPDFE